MKCFHHNDHDGRCAAAIVRKAYPAVELIEMDYSTDLDVDTIQPGERLFIVDFSFKPYVFARILEKTTHVTWIDHHKSVMVSEYAGFSTLPGIRCTSQSACVLTWEFFFQQIPVPHGVRLIGDKDTWTFADWRSDDFCVGLEAEDTSPQSGLWALIFQSDPAFIVGTVERGREFKLYRAAFCRRYCESHGFETEFDGHPAFALGLYMFGSQAFGDRIDKYPLLISFEFNGAKYSLGLYSKTLDCAEIARAHGGGGHKGAAGFTSHTLPLKRKEAVPANHADVRGLENKALTSADEGGVS